MKRRREEDPAGESPRVPPPRPRRACRVSEPRRRRSTARSRLDQRERERERRVSDADASYYATQTGARTPKHVIPKRNHAKKPTLISKTALLTRYLSQGPVKQLKVDHQGHHPTRSYVLPTTASCRCEHESTIYPPLNTCQATTRKGPPCRSIELLARV